MPLNNNWYFLAILVVKDELTTTKFLVTGKITGSDGFFPLQTVTKEYANGIVESENFKRFKNFLTYPIRSTTCLITNQVQISDSDFESAEEIIEVL